MGAAAAISRGREKPKGETDGLICSLTNDIGGCVNAHCTRGLLQGVLVLYIVFQTYRNEDSVYRTPTEINAPKGETDGLICSLAICD